jgi:hypothetical protein
MKENRKNLIVLFPGKDYTVTCPLLYYAYMKYERLGYECIEVSYGNFNSFDDAKNNAKAQINKLDFSNYNDIVFLSKSIGTVIASEIETAMRISIRHIYLTPVKSTLPFLKGEKNISLVVAGTKDPLLEASILIEHCNKEGIKLEMIENADHSLETSDDISTNIDILKQVVELY